ncbi:MAG: WD40/YVTN/BNR-like repeat-containing protein, partial [Dehalococcoidia bacterium]
GQTYCRSVKEVPGDPNTLWVAAGANFRSDVGVMFRSTDGGMNFDRVDLGFEPKSTMFGVAFDERRPSTMFCASSDGEIWGSQDGGQNWSDHPLPEGATQVYALACG